MCGSIGARVLLGELERNRFRQREIEECGCSLACAHMKVINLTMWLPGASGCVARPLWFTKGFQEQAQKGAFDRGGGEGVSGAPF